MVGSPAEVDGGRVYIFSGSTYALRRTLAAPSATEDAGFGFNLRADGDRGPVLAIASFGLPNTPFPQRGRVYVFSGSVTPDFVIENPEPARFQLFGLEGLALEIDRRGNPLLAVGEFSQGEVSHNQGQAFVYSGATQLYKETSPDPAASNVFGISLTFADLRGFGWSLLVGAPGDTVDGVALSGRVYVFNARGTLSESLTSPHPQANDAFGVPVIVSRGSCETALVVGAPSTDLSGGRVEYFALRGNARDRERCRSRGS